MMKKAREKALKRAVELGALTEEDMELYGSVSYTHLSNLFLVFYLQIKKITIPGSSN